jgi:hypothetical protein
MAIVVIAVLCACGGGGASAPVVPGTSTALSAPAPAAKATAGATAAATATAMPSASPSAIPTVSPTVAPAGCGAEPALQNGVEYATGWAPYACATSPWNLRVSAGPTYASYSSAVVATEFAGGNTQPVREEEAGPYDYGHPIYYASASDPLVSVHCVSYCDTIDNGGLPASIYLPAQARPAGGADAHMAVIQPDGSEIDMWSTTAPAGNWVSGATVTAQSVADCGNFARGSGFTPTGPAATAGGACLAAGLLRANELLAGSIDHALALVAQCVVGWQYPAYANASSDTCTSGQGPALGGRLWYDVPDATTNANTALRPWEKAILNALHDYGGYLEDDFAGGSGVSGIGFMAESGEAPWAFGQPDPFAALAAQGWNVVTVSGSFTPRYVGADPWQPTGVNFAAHMHWLDPCSARGSC